MSTKLVITKENNFTLAWYIEDMGRLKKECSSSFTIFYTYFGNYFYT